MSLSEEIKLACAEAGFRATVQRRRGAAIAVHLRGPVYDVIECDTQNWRDQLTGALMRHVGIPTGWVN